jgi:hypothetical protein
VNQIKKYNSKVMLLTCPFHRLERREGGPRKTTPDGPVSVDASWSSRKLPRNPRSSGGIPLAAPLLIPSLARPSWMSKNGHEGLAHSSLSWGVPADTLAIF